MHLSTILNCTSLHFLEQVTKSGGAVRSFKSSCDTNHLDSVFQSQVSFFPISSVGEASFCLVLRYSHSFLQCSWNKEDFLGGIFFSQNFVSSINFKDFYFIFFDLKIYCSSSRPNIYRYMGLWSLFKSIWVDFKQEYKNNHVIITAKPGIYSCKPLGHCQMMLIWKNFKAKHLHEMRK